MMFKVTFRTSEGQDFIYIHARNEEELREQFLKLNIRDKILKIEEIEI